MIDVHLRGGLPSPTAAHDAAMVLGRQLLAALTVPRCRVTVNANRRQVLSWRLTPPPPEVSVHWSLIHRPDDVVAVISKEPGAWKRLRTHLTVAPTPTPKPLDGRGTVHDLATLLPAEQRRLPGDPPEVQIGWGRWPTIAPRRSLRLGSYVDGRIRIHPVLDHTTVPTWFVGFILFHELLHGVIPPEIGPTGRRRIHSPAFRAAEATHPDHRRALAFESAHVQGWLEQCRRRLGGRT